MDLVVTAIVAIIIAIIAIGVAILKRKKIGKIFLDPIFMQRWGLLVLFKRGGEVDLFQKRLLPAVACDSPAQHPPIQESAVAR